MFNPKIDVYDVIMGVQTPNLIFFLKICFRKKFFSNFLVTLTLGV